MADDAWHDSPPDWEANGRLVKFYDERGELRIGRLEVHEFTDDTSDTPVWQVRYDDGRTSLFHTARWQLIDMKWLEDMVAPLK